MLGLGGWCWEDCGSVMEAKGRQRGDKFRERQEAWTSAGRCANLDCREYTICVTPEPHLLTFLPPCR